MKRNEDFYFDLILGLFVLYPSFMNEFLKEIEMNITMFDVCKKVKKSEVEKVAFSLKLPKHLKAKLDLVCHTEGVSANSFIVALLDEILLKDLKND